jgi:hypothetical protein
MKFVASMHCHAIATVPVPATSELPPETLV